MSQGPLGHSLVFHDSTKWAAVPANNGANGPVWQWGNELLVGFTVGAFRKTESGHQTSSERPFESWLARSLDGGQTWQPWKPNGYAEQAGAERTYPAPPEPVDFLHDGFTLRVEGNGHHGNTGCRWFASADCGRSRRGPFGFGNLMEQPELAGREFTARTGYSVKARHEALLFLSAREKREGGYETVAYREKPFVASTTDGGRSYRFVSWIVPWTDD